MESNMIALKQQLIEESRLEMQKSEAMLRLTMGNEWYEETFRLQQQGVREAHAQVREEYPEATYLDVAEFLCHKLDQHPEMPQLARERVKAMWVVAAMKLMPEYQ
jgi:hypothetical protein